MFLARGGFAIGPGPTYAPPAPRNRPRPTPAGAAPGSAGQVSTIGISTRRTPGRPGRATTSATWRTLATPTRTPTRSDEPDGQDELWPGVAPPVAYQGATGEVLHSKWVTFHEGPALLL